LAIVGSLASFFLEEISLAEMLQISVTSVLAICLRHGVAKSQMAAEEAVEAASVVLPPASKNRIIKKA
jgi:hypothetical protein